MLKATLQQQKPSKLGSPKRSASRFNHFADSSRVIEDSQVEEIPRTMAEIMGRDEWSPGPAPRYHNEVTLSPVTDRTIMADLFPSTPGGAMEETRVSRTSISRERTVTTTSYKGQSVTDPRLLDKKSSGRRQVEDSQSQTRNFVRFNPNLHHGTTKDGPASGTTSSQATGPSVAEITATNTLAARGSAGLAGAKKRNATTADLVGPEDPSLPKRVLRASTRTNTIRPVIADSQSPGRAPSLSGPRPSKLFKGGNKKGRKKTSRLT